MIVFTAEEMANITEKAMNNVMDESIQEAIMYDIISSAKDCNNHCFVYVKELGHELYVEWLEALGYSVKVTEFNKDECTLLISWGKE